mgnify:CR=1 FL=1
MSITGSIQTEVVINDEEYDLSVNIPTGKPLQAHPYQLLVYNKTLQGKTTKGDPVPVLLLMEAFYTDATDTGAPDNMYLELGPPASILPNITSGAAPNQKTTFAIKSLTVSFATGAFAANPPTATPAKVQGTKTPPAGGPGE